MNSRWGKLCEIGRPDLLAPLADVLGQPEVLTQGEVIRYAPGVFQVVCREDGIWIHSALLRRWRKRQLRRFFADCEIQSDFRARTRPMTVAQAWCS